MEKKVKHTGKHLIVNIYKCGKMPNHTELYRFLEKLVKLVKMNALTKPYIVEGAEYNPGITGFVIIETSHISVHTFEAKKFIALDIYSCITFNDKLIVKEIEKEFDTKTLEVMVIKR
jgi:S-adenosylmethionine decarboxylase